MAATTIAPAMSMTQYLLSPFGVLGVFLFGLALALAYWPQPQTRTQIWKLSIGTFFASYVTIGSWTALLLPWPGTSFRVPPGDVPYVLLILLTCVVPFMVLAAARCAFIEQPLRTRSKALLVLLSLLLAPSFPVIILFWFMG
jgi:TRAP-type uncharacterized transport system fused permease subunit